MAADTISAHSERSNESHFNRKIDLLNSNMQYEEITLVISNAEVCVTDFTQLLFLIFTDFFCNLLVGVLLERNPNAMGLW